MVHMNQPTQRVDSPEIHITFIYSPHTMTPMHLPDYSGEGIVNLMSSIVRSEGKRTHYKSLKALPPKMLKDSKNIFLIVLDGLGYEYLKEFGTGTFFHENLKGRMTSVFPSTTASCITTFSTGEAPVQHAVVGWYTYVRELGAICTPLPHRLKAGNSAFSQLVEPEMIVHATSLESKMKRDCYVVSPHKVVDSSYTRYVSGNAQRKGFSTLEGMRRQLNKLARMKKKKFIYSYWPDFDMIAHFNGMKSPLTYLHMHQLNSLMRQLEEDLEGTDSLVIVTADHGLIDIDTMIDVRDHPILRNSLSQPLSGELRAAYCYVHTHKRREFERYIKKELKDTCWLKPSCEAIEKGFFGLNKPHPNLSDRIGDYILLMKGNYGITDPIITEEAASLAASHGGVSAEEMYVPLIYRSF